MEGMTSVERSHFRRYQTPPRPESAEGDGSPIKKRYFDPPKLAYHRKNLLLAGVIFLCLWGLSASGTARDDLPTVEERFTSWAQAQNAHLISDLPGPTPEPDAQLLAALASVPDPDAVTPVPAVTAAVPTATPEPAFKLYAPGELHYEDDGMTISIEQIQENGLTYFLCDVQLSDVSQFATAFAGEAFGASAYETVSDIADRHDPVLAINGDFYRFHTEGVIIRNGTLYRKRALQSRRHLLIVDQDGNLSGLTDRTGYQSVVADDLVEKGTLQTFEFGPVLVQNGQAVKLPGSFYVKTGEGYLEPRTAIGQLGELHYLIIVVEGRRDGYSVGCDLPTLQSLFVKHGAQFAFNLDGGGSTTLYFQGEVINMPSSGAQRRVSDIIMFGGTLDAQ